LHFLVGPVEVHEPASTLAARRGGLDGRPSPTA
jgi:hypothetical protein